MLLATWYQVSVCRASNTSNTHLRFFVTSRVLRDRLVGLLEDADEVWGKRRQPWRTLRAGITSRGGRNKTRVAPKRGGASPAGYEKDRSSPSWRMCSLDSGAGPRKLWEAVAGPRFIEAGWKVDTQVRGSDRTVPVSAEMKGRVCPGMNVLSARVLAGCVMLRSQVALY